jgi:hypothetical protein
MKSLPISDILSANPLKGKTNNNLTSPPEHVAKPPFTRAGAYLSRRFCIHPEIADLVAHLAGLGLEKARR